MHRTMRLTLLITLLITMAAPASAQRLSEADQKAADAAKQLVQKRATLADVVAEMQKTFRQTAPQTANVLKALRAPAEEAATLLMRGYRLDGSATTTALLGGGYTASTTVSGSRRAGVRVGDMARAFRTSGVDTRKTAGAFKEAGIPVQEAIAALREAGVEAKDVSKATVETFGGSPKRIAGQMESAGYPTSVIYLLYKEMGLTAVDLAGSALSDGKDWEEAADMIDHQYGLGDKEIGETLLEAGFTFEAPRIDEFSIADFRNFGAGRIENVGIVDPKLLGSSSAPMDGDVTIKGDWLDLPGTTVRMVHDNGVTEGEVTRRSGGSGSSELSVSLEDFRSGALEVHTLGGVASVPALALSYRSVTLDQLLNPSSTLVMGDGAGSLIYGFTSGNADIPGPGSPAQNFHAAATTVSDTPLYSVVENNNWDLTVQATFPFNPVVTGTWSVDQEYWACGSFEIPVDDCSPLNASCIADQLGSAIQSALSCTNPDNWEKQSQPGPTVPLMATGVGAVTYVANVDISGPTPTSSPGAPAFSCIMAPGPTSAPMAGLLQAWSTVHLGPAVLSANDGFHEAVLSRLDNWQTLLPGLVGTDAKLRDAYGLPGNKVLLEFQH